MSVTKFVKPLLAFWLFALGGMPALAQDAVFVDSSGDVGVGTNLPSSAFHVFRADGTAEILVEEASATAAIRNLATLRNNGSVKFVLENTDTGGATWDFSNRPGGFTINSLGDGGPELVIAPDGTLKLGSAGDFKFQVFANGDASLDGTLTEGSSRTIKEHIVPVDPQTVLAKLERLPLSEWSYETNLGTRHMGPMAEDFYAIFGLGPDSKHIAPKDIAGVALAGVKALQVANAIKDKRIVELEARLDRLEALLEARH